MMECRAPRAGFTPARQGTLAAAFKKLKEVMGMQNTRKGILVIVGWMAFVLGQLTDSSVVRLFSLAAARVLP
jgi:hypothetical protein